MTKEERETAVKEFKEWRDSYYNKNKLPATMFIEEAIKALEQEPKTVSLSVYEQIRWERDVAIEQLKELGYGLGEKLKAVNHEHWIDNHNGTISCSYCHTWFNKDDRYSYMRYCPYCNKKLVESEE